MPVILRRQQVERHGRHERPDGRFRKMAQYGCGTKAGLQAMADSGALTVVGGAATSCARGPDKIRFCR
jgi:hypothetical protein